MPEFFLRPAVPDDEGFLLEVFLASHPEYDYLPVPPEQKRHIVASQFRLQTADYSARYPHSNHDIIVHGGASVGRVWSVMLDDELLIADIGLVAPAQKLGIGTAVMKRFQDEAARCGKPLRASVFKFNSGSLRWHLRMGFQIEREDYVQFHVVWRAT